ncbi:MAG: hypothetical protein HY270_00015 [Deltaproteobacteria bacterium]|nr:hypothetical protein [Deltaproteobacteria bacterium]
MQRSAPGFHLPLCLAIAAVLALDACCAQRPVLYPNDQYQREGASAAQAAVTDCMQRADEFVKTKLAGTAKAGQVAKGTAVGGATGAAIGAVGGAVAGDAGRGAAVGAATGATAGLLSSIFGVFQQPTVDPVYANFVERCLRERGYEPIGWK